jgi:hypothetical protein
MCTRRKEEKKKRKQEKKTRDSFGCVPMAMLMSDCPKT